ncbi:UNVERIFIED_CONTAM: lecithin retinol acyltransferase family protein [Aeromonas hydrophila]
MKQYINRAFSASCYQDAFFISIQGDAMSVSLSEELSPGDHLVCARLGFEHHGLYLGQGRVIHYAGGVGASSSGAGEADGIECVSLSEFAQGQVVRVIEHPHRRYDEQTAITRAYRRQGEQRYHPAFNNCEHFVLWCIEGVSHSPQVSWWLLAVARATGHPLLGGAIVLSGLLATWWKSPENNDE